ncbi:MAG: exodeoxyribonuclease III [Planctomycetes bacterium]|nr:exodeoxyribonuclease III [Planctomycetota bacterium]
MRILSWNVNGIRAAAKKGFLRWMRNSRADVVCIQETKASPDQLVEPLREPRGFRTYWASAEKKGYSGVATFSRAEPVAWRPGFGVEKFDREGRSVVTEFPGFVLFNVYFPNGKRGPDRLRYKLEFYEAILACWEKLRKKGKSVVVCGDVNTAHREIDLARPKENEKISGFLPIERKWIDKVLARGYVDVFRHLHPDKRGAYTWWHGMSRARERNVGWRIDGFFVSEDLLPRVRRAWIASDVPGSDHCPVGLEIADP